MNRRAPAAVLLVVALLAIAHGDDNPLARAKVGEWIIERSTITGQNMGGTYTFVSKVDGKKVTLVTQPLAADMKTATGPAQTRDPVAVDKPLPGTKAGEEEIEVKGKKVKCTKYESTSETKSGKLVTTTWLANDVPLYGRVRQIVKDKDGKELLRSDLVDYGSEGGKEKPVDEKKTEKDSKTEKK